MKTNRRLVPTALTSLALPALAWAQTGTTNPSNPGSPSTPVTVVGPAFETATPGTGAAVTTAVTTADAVRAGNITIAAPVARPANLTTAVTQANNAIVAENAATRSTALTQRQTSLARLRLAATE